MYKINSIEINDIEICVAIYQEVFAEEPWFEKFEEEKVKQYFVHCYEKSLYGAYVAKSEDCLCGFVTYFIKPSAAGNVLYIDEICVKKEWRKRGIGSNLIGAVERFANNNSIISLLIHTDKESIAYNLYKKMGYISDNSVVALYKNY